MNSIIQKGKITSYHSPSNFWPQLKVWWNHHSRGDRLWHHLYERKCWWDMGCMIQRDPRKFLDHKLKIILKLFVIASTQCMYHIIQTMHIILFKQCISYYSNNAYYIIQTMHYIFQTMPLNTKFDHESLFLLDITVQEIHPSMLVHAH